MNTPQVNLLEAELWHGPLCVTRSTALCS